MTTSKTGSFMWYELMTTDTKAAIVFYSHVVGWRTQPWEDGGYTMWLSEQGPLGGVLDLPEQARKMGAPTHWIASVTVADANATCAKARELGGTIRLEPMDIPKIGRFAVIVDPQGAQIAIIAPEGPPMPAHDTDKSGEFCWRELVTADQAKGVAFYSALFGWEKVGDHDMGPMGTYLLFGQQGRAFGGIFKKPKEMPVSAWIYYINVVDIDAAIARATAKGGKLLMGPTEVPGGARVAQMQDPQGGHFALLAPPKAAR